MLNDVEPFTRINPSAENLAKYFYDETQKELQSLTGDRVTVKEITIWETANAAARYSE